MRSTPIILALCAALPAAGQQPLTIVLDPARGGTEYGARIDEHTYEKQVTLDLANRLRTLLTARNFNVVLTREADALVPNDARAALANQNKPIACILLHATASGNGVHLWTSSLNPQPITTTAVLWDEAQSPFVQRSQRLASELSAAFSRSNIPISSGHTWIRPLDNMQCPAVAIEIAPRNADTSAADRAYQNRIADTIAAQMLLWRSHADLMQSILNPPPPPAPPKPEPKPTEATPGTTPATLKPRPKPTPPATPEAPPQ